HAHSIGCDSDALAGRADFHAQIEFQSLPHRELELLCSVPEPRLLGGKLVLARLQRHEIEAAGWGSYGLARDVRREAPDFNDGVRHRQPRRIFDGPYHGSSLELGPSG